MNRRPKVALVDVAKHAGVSRSTASRALRAEGRVSQEAISRVMASATALGYVPDKRAVQLRSQTPGTLGLILRSAELSFYGAIAAQMQMSVTAHGLDLLIANGGDDVASQTRAIESLVGQRVAGLVFASGRASSEALSHAASFVPTVLVGASRTRAGIDSVCICAESEQQMAQAVIDAGHRKVAVTHSTIPGTGVLRRRTQRYEETLHAGEADSVRLTMSTDATADSFRTHVTHVLEAGVTAIMAGDDLTALAIMELLDAWGVSVPHDVSVTGFDGVGVLRSPLLGLTTMEQPVEQLAATATELITSRISQSTNVTTHQSIPGVYIPGRTLGPKN